MRHNGKDSSTNSDDERAQLLNNAPPEVNTNKQCQSGHRKKLCRYWTAFILRHVGMGYVSIGLILFAVGFYWRTRTYLALLGPFACLLVVVLFSEYYNLKRKGHLKQCEDAERRLEDAVLNCKFNRNPDADKITINHDAV